MTITCSQTLGTALGDWTADTAGLGCTGAALIFGPLLILIAAGYYLTSISRTLLFRAAFILTRPLGAVLGDFVDKPINEGELALSLCFRIGRAFHSDGRWHFHIPPKGRKTGALGHQYVSRATAPGFAAICPHTIHTLDLPNSRRGPLQWRRSYLQAQSA